MNKLSNDSAAILIIDSDPLMLTAVGAVLNISGYECHGARDAEAAVKAVRGLKLDLIICDSNVDGDNGLKLCQELRELPNCGDIPFILVSSEQSPDNVRRTHEAGGAYCLQKPYDPEVLLELVEKALWMPHLVNSRIEQAHTAGPANPVLFAPDGEKKTVADAQIPTED
jgi:two-component system chemotaxis response regulator CheY